eukprot:3313075-Prymnesium_polylepis.1
MLPLTLIACTTPALVRLAPAPRATPLHMFDGPADVTRRRLSTPTQPSFERPYRADLRRVAVDTLDELRAPTSAALAHERATLLTRRERGLLYAATAAALSLSHRRVGIPAAFAIFIAARLGTSLLYSRPDPRSIVAPNEVDVAAEQVGALSADAALLGALTLAFGGCAVSASVEWAARLATGRAALVLSIAAAADPTAITEATAAEATAAEAITTAGENATAAGAMPAANATAEGERSAGLLRRTGGW